MGSHGAAIARLRGVLAGVTSAAVSIGAHAVGGGRSLSESSIVLLLLGCAALGFAASYVDVNRHELKFLMLTLSVGQVVGHVTLALGADHHHGLQLGPGMVAAHVAAVVIAAGLIRASGRGCAVALAALCRIIPTPFREPVIGSPSPAGICISRPRAARWLLVGSRIGTRGPPRSAQSIITFSAGNRLLLRSDCCAIVSAVMWHFMVR